MRGIAALCCLIGILSLAACSPSGQPTGSTTANTTTTESTNNTTVSTDDSAWSDTTWSDDFTWDDDLSDNWDDTDTNTDVETDSNDGEAYYKEIIPTGNVAQLLNPQTGGADKEAEALRQQILNAEDEDLNITGTTYYVSPNGDDFNDGTSPQTAWKTIDNVTINDYLLEAGDAVLFERGGVYRRTSPVVAKSGVTYAAYGEGEKPLIYGSATNYAWGMYWEPSLKENVWKITMYTREAGIMVFNHGEAVGMPHYYGLHELTENGDFYHNVDESTLYLYLDKGYPNVVYRDIEIGTRENVFTLSDETKNVRFDNLALRYAGMFVFDVQEFTENLTFTNLEIGWVGGCRYLDGDVGLGNGIQFWQTTDDALVENCWIYQIYDAGITPQGISGPVGYTNLVFRSNLIEFCNYSIEVFDRDKGSKWDGLVIEDNILRFAGYGFLPAAERPDNSPAVGHYVGWNYSYDELPGKGISICNNIFDCTAANFVYWPGEGKTYDSGLKISGNSFYQKATLSGKAFDYLNNGQNHARNQAELEEAVKVFDSNPKVVKWLS